MNKSGNNTSLVSNYLSILELRLMTLMKNCPPELRNSLKNSLAAALDRMGDPDIGLDTDELMACANLLETLLGEQEKLQSEAESSGNLPRIEQLRDCFDLTANEMLLLTAILAPDLDIRFREHYKLFQNSEEPRMDLLLSMLENGDENRYENAGLLGLEGKLISRGLVETVRKEIPGPMTTYRPSPGLLIWLNGARSVDVYLGRAEWHDKFSVSDEFVFRSGDIVGAAIEVAEFEDTPVPIVSFYGEDHDRLIHRTEALAADLNRPFLVLDLHGLEIPDVLQLVKYALRDCVMNKGVLVLTGCNEWIDSGGIFPGPIGKVLQNWEAPVVILTRRQFMFAPNEVQEKRIILRVPVEGLTGSRRFSVWKNNLSGFSLGGDVNDDALRTLAGQFSLNTAQIRSAVNAGIGKALFEDRDLLMADLYEGARLSSMHHLSDLAKKMEARYNLSDVVLPEKQTQEIEALIAMARNRSLVLEDWEVGKKLVSGRGISALFTGVPGTGKTLCAQAIAGELGLELYRVDLSTVVSKYIGETEKNLEHIFTEAQNSNVILFFDEADSLFGRRSDVGDSHDRYANIEVGYLLQRIEVYDGIVLMATNLGANLDEAFARRIHFIIDFPFPDEATRLRLWKLLLPENIDKEPDIDLKPFASAFKIAGGGIRNAVVWAIYEAARVKHPLSREDLLHGVEREYQKMGKVIPNIR